MGSTRTFSWGGTRGVHGDGDRGRPAISTGKNGAPGWESNPPARLILRKLLNPHLDGLLRDIEGVSLTELNPRRRDEVYHMAFLLSITKHFWLCLHLRLV
jgi:hypothetical protein